MTCLTRTQPLEEPAQHRALASVRIARCQGRDDTGGSINGVEADAEEAVRPDEAVSRCTLAAVGKGPSEDPPTERADADLTAARDGKEKESIEAPFDLNPKF